VQLKGKKVSSIKKGKENNFGNYNDASIGRRRKILPFAAIVDSYA
jgi:hypothetical protein